MTSDILLTIGIPVYNGEQLISQTLDSILPELKNVDHSKLEILISDNASTDNTEKIIKEKYLDRFGRLLSYYKNSKNEGFDGNADLVVRRAKGSYVWLFGCGETAKPGALSMILSKLGGNDYNNVILNFDIYSEKLGRIEESDNFKLANDIIFDSGDDFFRKMTFGITPLSANIISKDSWRRIASTPLVGFGWCHVERIISLLAFNKHKKTLYISTPCFTLWREVNGWWESCGRGFILFTAMRKIVTNMEKIGYSDSMVSALLHEQYASIPSTLYTSKLQGLSLNRELVTNAIATCYKQPSFWLFYLPILLLPHPCYMALRSAYKGAKRLASSITGNLCLKSL